MKICYRLTEETRFTLISVSAFYEDPGASPRRTTLVRFVTCEAMERYFGGGSGQKRVKGHRCGATRDQRGGV